MLEKKKKMQEIFKKIDFSEMSCIENKKEKTGQLDGQKKSFLPKLDLKNNIGKLERKEGNNSQRVINYTQVKNKQVICEIK